MFRSFRLWVIILQVLSLVFPLLKGNKIRLPLLLKELTILALTNSALIEKLLEKQKWSPEAIKNFLKIFHKKSI